MEREVIYTEDVEAIFGKRAWVSRSQEILDAQDKSKEETTDKNPASGDQPQEASKPKDTIDKNKEDSK